MDYQVNTLFKNFLLIIKLFVEENKVYLLSFEQNF